MRGLKDTRAPPIGIIDMDSTPPPIPASMPPTAIRSAMIDVACRPDEQKRLMVMAGTSSGRPASKVTRRATFSPCSPSGWAQPRTTSSIRLPGISARRRASLTTSAARSSGRVKRRFPFTARPMGVLTADRIATSRMFDVPSVPQRFAGGQGVLDAGAGLLLAAQGEERLALQLQQRRLAEHGARGDGAARQRAGQVGAHLLVVLADLVDL